MKRKRFVKLMMANGHDRNNANKLADMYKGERRKQLIEDFKVVDDLMRNYAVHDVYACFDAFMDQSLLFVDTLLRKSQQTSLGGY